MFFALALSAVVVTAAPVSADAERSVGDLQRDAMAAYQKGDKARFLAIYEDLVKRRPGDAYLLYNLACGQAVNGQTAAAEKTLLQLAGLRAVSDLDADTDLESVRSSAG